jgi:hypothetical protein
MTSAPKNWMMISDCRKQQPGMGEMIFFVLHSPRRFAPPVYMFVPAKNGWVSYSCGQETTITQCCLLVAWTSSSVDTNSRHQIWWSEFRVFRVVHFPILYLSKTGFVNSKKSDITRQFWRNSSGRNRPGHSTNWERMQHMIWQMFYCHLLTWWCWCFPCVHCSGFLDPSIAGWWHWDKHDQDRCGGAGVSDLVAERALLIWVCLKMGNWPTHSNFNIYI